MAIHIMRGPQVYYQPPDWVLFTLYLKKIFGKVFELLCQILKRETINIHNKHANTIQQIDK
jgi:hypothetical protein